MKYRWQNLSIGQKVLFCIQPVLIVLFIILYSTVGKQQVLQYRNSALRCTETDSAIVYSGKLGGTPISFRVGNNQVAYHYGERTAHYIVEQDPTAIPPRQSMEQMGNAHDALIGVEVHKNDSLLFRGAYLPAGNHLLLFDENGAAVERWSVSNSGDPTALTVLWVMLTPDVTQRANPLGLLCGMVLCIASMGSLLFADELFRWNLAFRIRNAEDAEPSDWELFSRWIAWVLFTILAAASFIFGLAGT